MAIPNVMPFRTMRHIGTAYILFMSNMQEFVAAHYLHANAKLALKRKHY